MVAFLHHHHQQHQQQHLTVGLVSAPAVAKMSLMVDRWLGYPAARASRNSRTVTAVRRRLALVTRMASIASDAYPVPSQTEIALIRDSKFISTVDALSFFCLSNILEEEAGSRLDFNQSSQTSNHMPITRAVSNVDDEESLGSFPAFTRAQQTKNMYRTTKSSSNGSKTRPWASSRSTYSYHGRTQVLRQTQYGYNLLCFHPHSFPYPFQPLCVTKKTNLLCQWHHLPHLRKDDDINPAPVEYSPFDALG